MAINNTKYCTYSYIMAILWYNTFLNKYGVMEEQWKDIDGYNGHYQISNKGRVRSWIKPPKRTRREEPYMMSLETTYQGYKRVTLHKNKKKKHESVHRLVANAFIPNPEGKPFINHIDGQKGNNVVSNIEWCTQSENVRHAIDAGRRNTPKGEDHYRTNLTKDDIIKIRELAQKSDYTQQEIGNMFGICQSHVSDIKNNNKWKHIR